MRLNVIAVLMLLAAVCYTISNDTTVVKADGTIDVPKLQNFVRNVPRTYQARKFNKFTVVPRPQDIGEGGIVFYSTAPRICYLYTLQNNTTFSVQLTP